MGLDAVVYRNAANISADLREKVALVDPETGELEFSQPEFAKSYPGDALVAASVALGNSSMIWWLAQEIRARCARCSLLLEGVLYSGTHSGDVVAVQHIAQLEQEVRLISSSTMPLAPDLKSFLDSMLTLITKARAEKNPIAFV